MKTIKHLTQKNAKLLMMACVLLCLPFLFISCEKTPVDPPPPAPIVCDTCLPDITTSGKRTFGCRINGKVWIPKPGYFTVEYFNRYLNVSADKNKTGEILSFGIGNIPPDTGYFEFPSNSLTKSRMWYSPSDTIWGDEYEANPMIRGYVHILRFDLEKGIIAGTFASEAYNSAGDTVHITDGRFDFFRY